MNNMTTMSSLPSPWNEMGLAIVQHSEGVAYVIPEGGQVKDYIIRIHLSNNICAVANKVEMSTIKASPNFNSQFTNTVHHFLFDFFFGCANSKGEEIAPQFLDINLILA